MNSSASVTALQLALTLATVAPFAAAQASGLRNALRLIDSAGSTFAEYQIDTGVAAAGPLFTPATCTGISGATVSTITCSSYSDYGSLRFVGAGHAAANGVGCFFRMTDAFPGPKAQFIDQVTIASMTLPRGTPVQIRGDLRVTGFAWVVGFNAHSSHRVELVTNQGPVAALVDSVGSTSGVLQTTVGSSLTFTGRLAAALQDFGVERGQGTASLRIDLAADFEITSLTPGATLQFASGTNYDHALARSQPVGVGCGVGPPSLASTAPVLGSTCTFSMQNAPASQAVIRGLAANGPSHNPFGACSLLLDVNTLSLVFAGTTDASGQWTSTLGIPAVPGLAGTVLSSQCVALLVGGPFLGLGETTNAVRLRVGF